MNLVTAMPRLANIAVTTAFTLPSVATEDTLRRTHAWLPALLRQGRGWCPRGLRRWITFPGNDFRRRKSFIDLSATARFGRSISTTSVAIELDQPLVADPEVMRDLVEHDVPDLAA